MIVLFNFRNIDSLDIVVVLPHCMHALISHLEKPSIFTQYCYNFDIKCLSIKIDISVCICMLLLRLIKRKQLADNIK